MQITDGQLVIFLGDSVTEHAVAVSDAMETQTADLPPVGAPVPVDRYEHRGWTALLTALVSLLPGAQGTLSERGSRRRHLTPPDGAPGG